MLEIGRKYVLIGGMMPERFEHVQSWSTYKGYTLLVLRKQLDLGLDARKHVLGGELRFPAQRTSAVARAFALFRLPCMPTPIPRGVACGDERWAGTDRGSLKK